VQLKDLKKGDNIKILKNTSCNNYKGDNNIIDIEKFYNNHGKHDKYDYFLNIIPKKMTKELAYLIGIIVGDGTYTTRDYISIVFGGQSRALMQNVLRVFQKVYGNTHYNLIFKKDNNNPKDNGRWNLNFTKKVREHLLLCGLKEGINANKKEIPSSILKADKESQIAFLRGLFDTDGYASKTSLGYCFASKILVEQIQMLFLHLGVNSNINKIWNKKYKRYYFKNSISNKLDLFKIFFIWWKCCKSYKYKNLRKHLRNYFSNRKNTTKYILENDGLNQINRKVTSIKKEKVKDYKVYDFVVPNYHMFVANGIINHNCDTDIVFRRLIEQLQKTRGFLIVFQQLKEDNSYFAKNMVKQFPSLSARYIYDNPNDGTYGKFYVDVIRRPIRKMKNCLIPCTYNFETSQLIRNDELKENIKDEQIIKDEQEET
jgi:intein/homing endonuclease